MSIASLLNPPPLLVEIGPDSLRARHGPDSITLPLERGPDGRLTAPGKETTIAALKNFLKTRSWLPAARAWCAIGSRGVSIRRLSLPGGTREEFHQRLLLQIEAEFPLSPDELAWGYQSLGQPPSNGTLPRQDLLVAAVKKDWVADYHDILRACGTKPVFTLAALARWNACHQPAGSFALLDIGTRQSELTIFEDSLPALSRIIYWDSQAANVETLAQAINASYQNRCISINSSTSNSCETITTVKVNKNAPKLFISGNDIAPGFIPRLSFALGSGYQCEPLAVSTGESTAIAGLDRFASHAGNPPLILRLESTAGAATNLAALEWKTWAARVGALLAAVLLLSYAEALLLKPHLEKKVAAFKTEASRLKTIDRELDFLRDLKVSQPPYLDVLYVFSKSVPPGTHFDSLSLNRRGEVSLRAAFHDGQQVADFRNKMIASGFFTNVVVEEQVPTPDRQRVNVRMSAQERTAPEMQQASARLVADDANKEVKPALPGAPPTTLPPAARKEPK